MGVFISGVSMERKDIRLSLPSKGRLEVEALDFLARCGLEVSKLNPRQYQASMPALPGLTVLFQRPADIMVGVQSGSIDFGITGLDVVNEQQGSDGGVILLHDDLGFGRCRLELAVPEEWKELRRVTELASHFVRLARPMRIATKFPVLTENFLRERAILADYELITAQGTLEVAPAIGYADIISDLVSSGQTLRDNRLRTLEDGCILSSQGVLIGNRRVLTERPSALRIARLLLEFIEAHLRAEGFFLLNANVRGDSPELIATKMFAETDLGGLQGPTISRVLVRDGQPEMYAVQVIVPKDTIADAVSKIRGVGGSGVVVSPVTYIFEEEPVRFRALLETLES